MTKDKKLLIVYDWFYPGFRAGGPIQSLTNLTIALASDFDIYIFTGATDLNAAVQYPGVQVNGWNNVRLPGSEEVIKVFYADGKVSHRSGFLKIVDEVQPSVVYLNGIFSYRFFLRPLWSLHKNDKNRTVIVCPRGMLKKGALSGKALKKKFYIKFLTSLGILKRVMWHATTSEEAGDIAHYFPVSKGIVTAANIPKSPYSKISYMAKSSGQLSLVFLSLINEHKNVLLLLQLLKATDAKVTLDIYGPVIDEVYWSQCLQLMNTMQGKVQYKGAVQPAEVQHVLSQYHALILLTKGENFGHAIYESLSVGRPVITSHYTPWQNLQEKKAGANVDIAQLDDCKSKMNTLAKMQQEAYSDWCAGAHTVAANYYTNLDVIAKYKELFIVT